jgi:hypothetical protein
MEEQLIQQAVSHVHAFFFSAKLNKKKWYREIKNNDDLFYSFFVLRRRMIQPKNYVIHEAPGLYEKNIKPEVLRDYQSLKDALTLNGDLKKFHTENSKIIYPIDSLLEEYNINHLHLDRSRYQVFFMTDGNDIFMINICKHFERNRTGYSKNSLLEIVNKNWPDKRDKRYYAIDKNRLTEKYASAYAWEKVSQFYSWLRSAEKSVDDINKYELTFIGNQAFIVNEINSKNTLATILPFEA